MRIRLAGIVTAAWLCLVTAASAAEPLTLLDAAGLRAELNALNGRVVLVNFWATWCRSCLEEIPALMELESELQESGFSLVAVSLDEPDSGDTLVRPFMEKWFPDFTSYLSIERDMDDMVSVVDPAWDEILPSSYLLARDGSVAERIQGKNSAEEFKAKIQPLVE
jgi:thiol-disulfide isomerase/thioredoxin